jgi:PAS domain S-box-containing protein
MTELGGADNGEQRYQAIFQHAAISIWEEDISELREAIRDLRSAGVQDLPGYLLTHPEFVKEATRMVQVVDVNDATLKLYGVKSKEDLQGSLSRTLDLGDPVMLASIRDMICLIEEGEISYSRESTAVTPAGIKLNILIETYIPHESNPYSYMLVSVRDITEQRRAEEELHASEERYRSLVHNLPMGVLIVDTMENIVFANPVSETTFAAGKASITGMNLRDFMSNEDFKHIRVETDKRSRGETSMYKINIKRLDGEARHLQVTATPRYDSRGEFAGALGTFQDITDQTQLAQSLEEERELLLTLINSLPDLVFIKDRQSRFILVNRSLAQLSGASDPKELIGKFDRDFIPSELADKYVADDRKVLETAQSQINTEELSTFAPGSSRWILTTKVPLVDKGGKVTGLMGISRDITERKLAEERIQGLARFPDENPDPVLRVTPNGSIIYANKASEALKSSWVGDDRKVPEEYLRALTLAWETGEKREIEIRNGLKSYIFTFVPFTAAGYINLYGRDVTEEKALTQRLNQAQKMEAIGQLSGGIAHDFNNVLQVITGYCEVLKQELPEKNQQYVFEITKAAQRAATLIAQLLAFSRKQTLKPRVVDPKDLIHSMQKMLERVIGEDIELRTFIDPNTGNFLADPGQMEQALLNLAVNSRDAMPSGGKLTLETSNRTFDEGYVRNHPGAKAGRYVRIAVSDTGVGMDQETLSHIYEPFFTTKERGRGTGLGLSTVFGIVKQSEGYINCYSEPGKGTTFTIYLPLTLEEASKPLVAVSTATVPTGTETILLVDDESAIRSVARITLEQAGYVVIEASGGEEALAAVLARNITVALLVTDIVMPRMSGNKLARRLQEIFPKVRVLYVSGYTANVISDHGIPEGGVDFLQKPFSALELLTRVREILDRP